MTTKEFKKDWTNEEFKQSEKKVFSFLKNKNLITRNGNKVFHTNKEIDNFFGFAFTSSSSFAGLWLCNESLFIDANKEIEIQGFALNDENVLFAYCTTNEEKEILIPIF